MGKPGTRPGFFVFLYCFKYTYRTITDMPLFGKFDVLWFVDCGRVFHCGGGLTDSGRFEIRGRKVPGTRYQVPGGVRGAREKGAPTHTVTLP